MKKAKIILIILIIITFIFINRFTFAIEDPNDWAPNELSNKDRKKAGTIIGDILANIRVIGICISVVMLTVIGLKYILSSVDEKANYKENMTPYVVGCFLLASATTIPSIIYDLANN